LLSHPFISTVIDELNEPALTIKAIGISDTEAMNIINFLSVSYGSFIVQRNNLKEGQFHVIRSR